MSQDARRAAATAATWVVLAAVLALAGIPLAGLTVYPSVQLPPASGAGFALAALALLAHLRGATRCSIVLGVPLVAGALAGVAGHVLAADFPASPLPRLIPAPTAFGLVLMGMALLATALAQRLEMAPHVAHAGAGTAILVALVSIADHWLGIPARPYPLQPASTAATALFVLLGGAVLATARARPVDSDRQRINLYAAWTPTLLAALVFAVWTHLEAREWNERAQDAALARDTIAQDVAARLRLRGDALQRLADRWRIHGDPGRARWEAEAAMYLRDFPTLHAVLLTDVHQVVRWRVARPGSPDLVGRSIAFDDGRMETFEEAARLDRVRLSRSLQLRSGGTGLIFVAPVRDRSGLHGYITASMRSTDLLAVAGAPALRDFGAILRDSHGAVAGRTAAARNPAPRLTQRGSFEALGQQWWLEVWPESRYLSRMRSRLPETAFLLGLCGVGLVAAALMQLRRSVVNSAAARGFAQRLTATLESITDAFFTLDADWRFTYVNAEAERLLQCPRGELLGRVVWDAFPEAVGTSFQSHYEQARREGVTVVFEAYYPPLGRWLGVRAYPARAGLAVYFQDMTEIVRGREALRESERELRALAESMPQMVWMALPDGYTTYFNERWLAYSGMAAEDSRGYGWLRSVHPEDLEGMRAAWAAARRHGSDYSFEGRLRGVDGSYRWMLVRAVPFKAPAGTTLKWMGTCTDIDEIRQSGQAVRQSEERFRLLSEASEDAIWDWDLQSGSVWWSDSFEQLFGHGEDGDRTFETWSERIHPEDRARTLAELHGAVAEGRTVWNADYRFRRAGGEWARVSNRGYVIRDPEGRAIRLLGGMSDVTRRMALEDQLRQAQRLESVGQLTGGVAHDFNNLLTVILGNAEALSEELAGDPALGPMAEMVVGAAERGADLTQRLLAFGRKQALAPVPVDLQRQLAELEPLLRRTLGEHIEVRIATRAGLWHPMVDPAQLDNALLNLCLNARDAMPGGGRLLLEADNLGVDDTVPEAAHLAPGDYVLLAVRDTGTGIAPQHAERLFEPFFTTKEIGKGTGLGLPMVYGFLKQSGGHIDIESAPGRGTTVRVYLPRAAQPVRDVAAPPSEPIPTGDAHILLVEDDALVRGYALAQLRSLGYRVHAADSAARALEILSDGVPVDLLFTDVVMPGGSGPQLAANALRLRPRLRVLYTSGYAQDAMAHHAELAGGVDLLRKPYPRQELARRIRLALGRPPSAARA